MEEREVQKDMGFIRKVLWELQYGDQRRLFQELISGLGFNR
jgi:hypothetical protein